MYFQILISVFKYRNGDFRPHFVINKTEDFCEYARKPSFIYLTHFLYPEMIKYGTLPKTCPIRKVCTIIFSIVFLEYILN